MYYIGIITSAEPYLHFLDISISVNIRFVLIVMHIKAAADALRLRDALDLDDSAISGRNRLETGPRWHRLRQEVYVRLIHSRKVLHIRQVHIVLNHFV